MPETDPMNVTFIAIHTKSYIWEDQAFRTCACWVDKAEYGRLQG